MQHIGKNKLRDVEDMYSQNGHEFSFGKDILYSFDICGSCEAHALLLSLKHGLVSDRSDEKSKHTVSNAVVLKDLPTKYVKNNANLQKCPL